MKSMSSGGIRRDTGTGKGLMEADAFFMARGNIWDGVGGALEHEFTMHILHTAFVSTVIDEPGMGPREEQGHFKGRLEQRARMGMT